jgi:hypothetical protein
MCDTMGERIGRIGQIYTDFFCFCLDFEPKFKKIRANPPDPLNPFSHRITHSEIRNPHSEIPVNVRDR